ncbi:MAG: glycerol-3-phosphate 1-O-acyltransferase PlsY [Clostridia bacterium]|nr:glycerol-3-phosphate 1-O-acyltransferase PlsY [Clostridia bacterium]MDD4048209.1 glycerol-3-phosphate 1-O-acyltransferase PlsY [Clostridia bacterium]
MRYILVILLSYLIGSISFGIIVTRLVKGEDIRKYGSGNTGFTNVLRVVGTGPALFVIAGDAFKGAICVILGSYIGGNMYCAVLGGLVAMAGHTYPLYHGFRGGKGVATGLGVTLTLAPDVTLIAIAVFAVSVLLSRYVSLGSILGAFSVPLSICILGKQVPILLFGILAALFVVYRHKSNIIRIYKGEENKIGKKTDNDGGIL